MLCSRKLSTTRKRSCMKMCPLACCEANICSPFVCKQDAARIASVSGFCANRQSSIRTFLLTCLGGISLRTNGSCGWRKRRGSQNNCREGTAPTGSSPSSISSKSARGDAVARDGCNHYARERKNGAALGCERQARKESERFKSFSYEDLIKRDKLNLDIFWLKDESLEDSANLSDPDVIAAEIVEHLQVALAQFAEIAADLKK